MAQRNTQASRRRGTAVAKPIALAAAALLALGGGYGLSRQLGGGFTLEHTLDGQEVGAKPEGTSDEVVAQPDAGESEPEPEPEVWITVHVDGAVAAPGVYTLKGDIVRVTDACEAAGGLLAEADTSGVNLAAPLADGVKVHIPLQGEEPVAPQAGAGAATAAAPGLVNINSAGADELMELSGVGEATAQAIIQERERGGPFTSIEDIMRVPGIGEKKFERMKDGICV